MTLIERYLRAVRDHLPRDQQDDIIDELADSIESRIEDEQATLGRPLAEDEQVAILRGFGHPMAVAARYRGDERTLAFGRQLIGPELFPTYLRVLAVTFVVSAILLAITVLAAVPSWSGLGGLVAPFAIQFVAVTAIFVAVDRRWIRDPNGWDPRTVTSTGSDLDLSTVDAIATQLIGKEHPRAVPLTISVLEIGLLGVALAAWLAIGSPERMGFLAPGPGWRDLVVPITATIVVSILLPIVTLVRPTWTRLRVAGHALVDLATIAIGLVSLGIGRWVVLADPATAPPDAARLVDLLDTIIRISIAATVVLTAVNAALEIRRLVRMSRPAPGAEAVAGGAR